MIDHLTPDFKSKAKLAKLLKADNEGYQSSTKQDGRRLPKLLSKSVIDGEGRSRQVDLSNLSSMLSKPKKVCLKHGHDCSPGNEPRLLLSSLEMIDRHRSSRSLLNSKVEESRSRRSVAMKKHRTDRSLPGSIDDSQANIMPLDFVMDDSLVDSNIRVGRKTKKHRYSKSNRCLNDLKPLPDPLAVNPSRSTEAAVRFGQALVSLGQKSLPTEASYHKAPMKSKSLVKNDSVKLPQALKAAGLGPSTRRNKGPPVHTVIDVIRKNGNHMLCRLTQSLKFFRNILDLHQTLEGQKEHLSHIFLNRLEGQFSKKQLDLCYSLFFDGKSMLKPTLQLTSTAILAQLFVQREDQILMDVERRQLMYLKDKMADTDNSCSIELIVELYYSRHFHHDDEQLEVFPHATDMFMRLITEAKSLYYGYLSSKSQAKIQGVVNKTTELRYLRGQSDLQDYFLVRAGKDFHSVFLKSMKRGLGIDRFKGRGIDRGGEMGEGITKEEKLFNRKLKDIIEDLREVCN